MALRSAKLKRKDPLKLQAKLRSTVRSNVALSTKKGGTKKASSVAKKIIATKKVAIKIAAKSKSSGLEANKKLSSAAVKINMVQAKVGDQKEKSGVKSGGINSSVVSNKMSKSAQDKIASTKVTSLQSENTPKSKAVSMPELDNKAPGSKAVDNKFEASPLKKKDLEKFKELLEEEKRKIVRHLEELSESSEQELDLTTGDPVDIASLEINQANLQKIGKREKYLLKKMDLALEKIADGTYGECESCGEAISVQRLMARPVAQLCIDCKTQQENVERRFSSREREAQEHDEIFEEETEEV